MFIIIGLGNPGKKYEDTRHNTGFMLVERLQREWNFPEFKFDKKFNAEISKGVCELPTKNSELLLAKPATYMNNSGQAVQKIVDFYKMTPADIIVIHDDLDIELGKYKMSEDSRAAGHNGVQDIIDKLGTQNFKRIRIGIEGEEKRKSRLMPSDEFVLQNFSEEELKSVQNILPEIIYFFSNIISNKK